MGPAARKTQMFLGDYEDIRQVDVNDVCGEDYGQTVCYMRRKGIRTVFDRQFPTN